VDYRGDPSPPPFSSDRLWAVDTQQDQLLRVDPNSGAILQSIPITLGGNRLDLLGFITNIAFDIYGNAYIKLQSSWSAKLARAGAPPYPTPP
jgi:hypothetical protein